LTFVTHEGGTTPTWRGASAEAISTYLERYVPAQRIIVDINGECPLERIDLEKQLAKLQESSRALRWCLSIFGTLLVATLVWMAVAESIVKALIMTGVSAIPIVPLAWFVRSDTKKKTKKIEEQLAEFDASIATSDRKKL
jgi:Flp pilus assembly protein TadB